MTRILQVLALSIVAMLAGVSCSRFKPGYSMDDSRYFQERPHIVAHNNDFRLRWKYGSMGFFFQPTSKVVDGRLCFYLQDTSSSGNLSGQIGELPMVDQSEIAAFNSGGAYWLEPNGSKIPLQVQPQ